MVAAETGGERIKRYLGGKTQRPWWWTRSSLSKTVATRHMWLLSPWNAASLNWDVLILSVKYTLDFEGLIFKNCAISH